MAADQPFTATFALNETVDGLFGVHAQGSPHFAGAFGDWFPVSLLLMSVSTTAWIVLGWLAPWRHRVVQEERDRALAHALVHAWGADTLAPFVLRSDKSYFFTPDESAFLAYRVVGGVAIVSGDPIGPGERLPEAIGAFVDYAHARDWRIAILGASEQALPLYAAHGLHSLYHGDEAVVETGSFTLEGRPIRKVRQSVTRLEKRGYSAQLRHLGDLCDAELAELESVSRSWRRGEVERGFTMSLDELRREDHGDSLVVLGRDAEGRIGGFLHFAPSYGRPAVSLSLMRRRRDTPNGLMEFLVARGLELLRDRGVEEASLNFAAFGRFVHAPRSRVELVVGRGLLIADSFFQIERLHRFNAKFFPRWEPRYLMYEHALGLPRVGLAALWAEGQLPRPGRRRR
jgi:lysyl-tRNA synthetase class 2